MPTETIETVKADLAEAKAEIAKLKSDLDDERKAATVKIAKAEAATEVAIEALAAGVNPGTLQDLKGRIETAGWTMSNGQAVMPGSPIGPREWVDGLKTTARHFFLQQAEQTVQHAPTAGYGAQNGGGQNALPGGKNPWAATTWDDMAQARIYKASPEQAAALAAAAGSYLGALDPALKRKSAH